MMPDEVGGEIPVEVEGQILCLRKYAFGTFLHDGTNGIYMSHREAPEMVDKLRVGDWIRVKGVAEPGGFSPGIFGHDIEIIDHQPLPKAKPYDGDDRNLATMDCQWVSIQGLLVSVAVDTDQLNAMLTVESGGKTYAVQTRCTPDGLERLTGMVFQEVQLNAVVATLFNLRKQGVGRTFIVHSPDDIVAVNTGSQTGAAPFVSIAQLMRKDFGSYDRVRTRGIVTGTAGKELFLRGDSAALRVLSAQPIDAKPGDYVELLGYVWPQPVSPAFRALGGRTLRTEAVPEPRRVGRGLLDDALNYDLIQLPAHLIDIGTSFSFPDLEQQTLLCRSGSHLFEAQMPPGMKLSEGVSIGAQLQLTGFTHLIHQPGLGGGLLKVGGFWLQLRGLDDIQVIQDAPWWTPERVILGVASLGGILVLVVGWVLLLRRTVHHQTGIIRDQVERESVLNERQRIARELHDSLEQGLAGMAIQLEGTLRQQETFTKHQLEATKDESVSHLIQNDAQQTYAAIKTVQEMLVHCNEESRSTIMELRSGLLERMDLPSALKETLEPLAKEWGAQLNLTIKGESAGLDQMLERDLLLVAKEAVTNAVRHGNPNTLQVALEYNPENITLMIEDNGSGFDTNILQHTNRFGVLGMRERMNKHCGTLTVESQQDEGTTVLAQIAL